METFNTERDDKEIGLELSDTSDVLPPSAVEYRTPIHYPAEVEVQGDWAKEAFRSL